MSSPIRKEESGLSLGALTPIVHVIKNAQSNATRDFDRFYDNLWAKLTPRTSTIRHKNKTPERNRSDDECSTSLTPLIQRHSLREDTRYDYVDRNPFYRDTESEIAETPGLEAETPITGYTPRPKLQSPRRSMIQSNLTQKIAEEKIRIDRLQHSVNRIKRQSSFLADPSARACDFLFEEDEDDEEEEEEIVTKPNVYRRPSSYQYSTPTSISNKPITPTSIVSNKPITPKQFAPMKRSLSPTRPTPSSKRVATTPTRKSTETSNKRFIVSPKRIVIDDLPATKLRSTELISTPGGSMVTNRFWKEIHGSPSTRTKPITERISTLTQKSQTWANDDHFWSVENTPVSNTFNNKLFQVANQEKEFSEKLLRLAKDNNNNNNNTLNEELEEAQKKQDILNRNNIPKMNPNLIAELKAKYQSKFIDDSDEYKFN